MHRECYHTFSCTPCPPLQVAVVNIPPILLTASTENGTGQPLFNNIRITTHVLPGLDNRLVGVVTSPSGALQRAIQTISGSLLVRPLRGNFTIPYPCVEWTSGINKGKCRPPSGSAAGVQCGPLAVPAQFVGARDTCQSANASVCNRTQQQGSGANADFLLLVGSANSA